jgi:opacity protein-like surface antigen
MHLKHPQEEANMKTLRLLMILSILTVLVIPAAAMAEGLSGKKYGFALLGARDYDRYSDPSLSIKLGANLPIDETIDITPFFIYETADDDTSLLGLAQAGFDSYTLGARGDYFITEKGSMKIYAGGGIGYARTETTACVTLPIIGTQCTDASDSDLYFQAHGGMDMDMGEKIGLRPECAYTRIGNTDDVNCGAMFNLKLGKSFDLLAEARFYLDNREIYYSIGGGLTF